MRLFGIEGMSVTMPHKADVARAVDARTAVVDLLEVCNCVFRDGDLLVGDSTDGDGFVRSLLVDDGIDLEWGSSHGCRDRGRRVVDRRSLGSKPAAQRWW